MNARRQMPTVDPAAALEIHQTGAHHVLEVGPRNAKPITDDLVVSIGHRTYGQPTSVLVSRAQTQELYDWLGRWLADGWPGVARREGPTSADVIEHYRDIAGREQMRADHTRIDAAREVGAALALIPKDRRTEDLDAIAKAQGQAWWRLQQERDHYKNTRDLLVQCLHEMAHYRGGDAETLRRAADKALKLAKHPKPVDGPVPPAPVYDVEQLDLLAEVTP